MTYVYLLIFKNFKLKLFGNGKLNSASGFKDGKFKLLI
jgi:hypothetical protein